MSSDIVGQLAHSIGRSDEEPNIRLAEKIVKSGNKSDVKEIISLLDHKTTGIRSDAIKVLYEIAGREVNMVIPYTGTLISLLAHRDNRMRWGAMSALSAISHVKPALLVNHLATIVDAMDSGTVITRDHGIYILSNVARLKTHHDDCMELLLDQIAHAPANQVPMYAEKTAEVITGPYHPRFEKVLVSRKDVLGIPSKKKRIEKILKSLKR